MAYDDSFLDKRVALRDLMDVDTLRDLCAAFAEYFRVNFAVYDDGDKEVVRIGAQAPFCTMVEGVEPAHRTCESIVSSTATTEVAAGRTATVSCFSGLKYAIIPLSYQMEYIGRAVVGPYRLEGTPALREGLEAQGLNADKAFAGMQGIQMVTEDVAGRAAKLLSTVMEVFLFISAKRLFTTMIHVQTLYKARDDIFRQMQTEVTTPQERDELEQLKSMF